MDSILMKEEPLIRKCCFVIPLRFCLQTWAFIKLALDLVGICYMAFAVLMMFAFGGSRVTYVDILVVALVTVALAVDIGFLTTLTVGIFNKNITKIRIFYFYEWFAMAVETSIIIFIIVDIAKSSMNAGCIVLIFIGICYILLDLCIIITLKSEMVKLRNKNQFDFSQMTREGEVTGKLRSEEV